MGAVFGVYLKYVALSAGSAVFCFRSLTDDFTMTWCSVICCYCAVVNGLVAFLFAQQKGMSLIGKTQDGKIPLWSYILFAGFHLPTILYTAMHTYLGENSSKRERVVPVATEIRDGWWLGGRYGDRLGIPKWGPVVDLTVEFPETLDTDNYLLLRCWDGVPPTPAQLEQAASFCADYLQRTGSSQRLPIMIHCAHGRGRSTCTMCAAFVRAGLYSTWEAAFEAIKEKRHVVRLNRKMKNALIEWTDLYCKKQG